MSTLRDPRTHDDFKTVTNRLTQHLKNQVPGIKLHMVQEGLAQALGARDLQAFLGTQPSRTDRVRLMEYARDNWYFIALKSVHGDHYYLHTPEEQDTQNFMDIIQFDVALMTKERAEAWLAQTAPIGEGGGDDRLLRPLGYEPLLLTALFLDDAKALEQLCRQLFNNPSGEFPYLGMDIDAWDHESMNRYTRLGYYDWVIHQLDNWLNDQPVMRDTDTGAQS